MTKSLFSAIILLFAFFNIACAYSALEDYKVIKEYLSNKNVDDFPPVPPRNHAKVARALVHKSSWASIGTISTALEGYPMVNIISIADSAVRAKSTGIIYFLMTDLDFTGKDLKENNKVTVTITSDEDEECKKKGMDTLEPICPRIIISGHVQKIETTAKDYNFGYNSFISRHPAAREWVKKHNFYLCKLDINNIFLIDYYGGAKNVSVNDYYKAKIDSDVDESYLEEFPKTGFKVSLQLKRAFPVILTMDKNSIDIEY